MPAALPTAVAVELDMTKPLEPQLASAPRDAPALNLDGDTPTDAAWALLAAHFTSVRTLYTDSGWDENLNDAAIPLHWPLEQLTIGSACGEVCRSPWIVEGRVPHLVLNYTAGLRFEGPTSAELMAANDEKIARGEKEEQKLGHLTITYLPELAMEWMHEKYAGKKAAEDEADGEGGEEEVLDSRLKVLEIVHNDVHDALHRYVLAHPRLMGPVETLSLVAISENDLSMADQNIFNQILPQLEKLKTLVLVLSDIYPEREQLPNFFECLPKTLRTLRFRSSVSLAREEVFQRWLDAFADPSFLPELETLSFVLDLEDGEVRRREKEEYEEKLKEEYEKKLKDTINHEDEEKEEAESTENIPVAKPPKVSDETLTQAKNACERLHRVAESRGIKVESFGGPWTDEFTGLDELRVDDRWEKL